MHILISLFKYKMHASQAHSQCHIYPWIWYFQSQKSNIFVLIVAIVRLDI